MSTSVGKKLKEQTTIGVPSIGVGGHIDLALGTFDRPGPNPNKDMYSPVTPREQMSTQLSVDRPPVEDEDYVPSSIIELSRAAAEIAKSVPPDRVKKFYLQLKKLAEENIGMQEITTNDELNMQETHSKEKLVKMIHEAMDDLDGFDIPGRDKDRPLVPYPDIIAAFPEEFKDVSPERRTAAAVDASLVGAGKLKAMIDQVPEEEINKLHSVAKDEYIDLLEEVLGDDAEPGDIDDLKSLTPDELYEMSDSYKYFFKAAFVIPAASKFDKAYRSATRSAISNVQSKLASFKLPSTVLSTVVLQLLGFSARKPQAIRKKLQAAADAGEIKPTEVDMRYKQLASQYAGIEAAAKNYMIMAHGVAAKDFVKNALDAYSKMSLDDRKNLVMQAFEKMG